MTLTAVVETYPDLFPGRDYHCGDGWAPLVDECCHKLRLVRWATSIEISIVQVKEKLGTLRVYLGGMEFVPGQEKWFDIIHDIVAAAERQSCSTCEVSGQYGEARHLLGWIKTLSDDEYQKALAKRCQTEEALAKEKVAACLEGVSESEKKDIYRELIFSSASLPMVKEALNQYEAYLLGP